MAWQKYILAFVITAAIFGTAFYIADALRRAARRRHPGDRREHLDRHPLVRNRSSSSSAISTARLIRKPSSLRRAQLARRQTLGRRTITWAAPTPRSCNSKSNTRLLEIKDYLLLEEIATKVPHFNPVFILYFYSNAGDCPQCSQEGDVLTYLRGEYPDLRVYSFDYNLDLSALHTLISLRKSTASSPRSSSTTGRRCMASRLCTAMQTLIPELKTLATTQRPQPTDINILSHREESNPGPTLYKSAALPTELRWRLPHLWRAIICSVNLLFMQIGLGALLTL